MRLFCFFLSPHNHLSKMERGSEAGVRSFPLWRGQGEESSFFFRRSSKFSILNYPVSIILIYLLVINQLLKDMAVVFNNYCDKNIAETMSTADFIVSRIRESMPATDFMVSHIGETVSTGDFIVSRFGESMSTADFIVSRFGESMPAADLMVSHTGETVPTIDFMVSRNDNKK